MVRIIKPISQEQYPSQKTWNLELPKEAYVQVYPRVSTPEQKKNVSAEMQQDKSFALLCGWTDELVIMEIDDLGLSGQLKMEDRPAFVKMLRNIASGKIKAVIAAQVDRLFRDRWGAEYAKFMEICFTYGIKAVTPNPYRTAIDFVYDFSIAWHVDKFRRKCEEAWSYLENHVYGRMLPAQRELGKSGFWAGGNIPMGYIVDRRAIVDGKENPNYRKYIPYRPHARIIRWLFERYRETAGRVSDIFREIDALPFLFPAFDETVDKEIISKYRLKRVFGEDGKIIGYKIGSLFGLRNILSNPVYAGYWVYEGVVVRSNNHEPIVDFGTFIYAFNRLSPYLLDGTPNPVYVENRKKYVKKYVAEKGALLNGQITTDIKGYKVYPRVSPLKGKQAQGQATCCYAFTPKTSGVKASNYTYMIPVTDVDNFFLQRFIERLQETDEFENFLDYEDEEKATQEQSIADVDMLIRAAKASMARIREQIRSGELTNATLLREANDAFNVLEQDLARLENRKKELSENTSQAQKRRNYKQMMREAGEKWDEVVAPEEMPMMIDAFVEKVVLTLLSPRFYMITVYWRDPEWGIDEMVCFRDGNPSLHWSQEEDNILHTHYATATREELLQLIPTRSYTAMRDRALGLGIYRTKPKQEEAVPHTFCWQDIQVMRQYGITEKQLRDTEGAKLIALAYRDQT